LVGKRARREAGFSRFLAGVALSFALAPACAGDEFDSDDTQAGESGSGGSGGGASSDSGAGGEEPGGGSTNGGSAADAGGAAGEDGPGPGSSGAAGDDDGAGGAAEGGQGGDDGGGTAGSGNPDCRPTPETVIRDFAENSSIQGWNLSYTGDPGLQLTSLTWVGDEGHACNGSLKLNAPFTLYVDSNYATATLTLGSENWEDTTKLHAWVKVPDPGTGNVRHLFAVQLAMVTDMTATNVGNYAAVSQYFEETLNDFGWHEIVLDFATASNVVVLSDVNEISLVLVAQAEVPDGGPDEPVSSTLFIDDIWLE
jgi:hypothetical protein